MTTCVPHCLRWPLLPHFWKPLRCKRSDSWVDATNPVAVEESRALTLALWGLSEPRAFGADAIGGSLACETGSLDAGRPQYCVHVCILGSDLCILQTSLVFNTTATFNGENQVKMAHDVKKLKHFFDKNSDFVKNLFQSLRRIKQFQFQTNKKTLS